MNKTATLIKLGDIANVTQGQSPESKFYSKETGTPFLQGNRTFGNLYPTFDTYTSKVTKIARNGDVLMSVRAPVGDLNIAPCDLCIGRGLSSLDSVVNSNNFIYYSLKHSIANLQRQGAATTYSSVSSDIINDFDVIVPKNKDSWDSIAKVLFNLDTKIEINNKLNQQFANVAKLIYDYWFVQFDFPDENGKPYKSSGGKMMWSEELKRDIPNGWEVQELRAEIEIQRGISYTSKEINNQGVPMINLNSFNLDGTYKHDGVKTFSGKYSSNNIASPGELLIAATDVTRNADIIGKAILVPDYYDDVLVFSMDVAKIMSSNIPSSFLMLLFNSKHYHNYIKYYATGTLVLHLNLEGIKRYKISLPPVSLLDRFDSLYIEISNRVYKTTNENQKLAELRDWLLPMLMNGQVKLKS